METWVTWIESEEDATNCIVLNNALKRFKTTKHTAAIVRFKDIPPYLLNTLHHDFDFVFEQQNEIINQNELTMITKIQLIASELKEFNKWLYIAPNLMVLENMDRLFEISDIGNDGIILSEPDYEEIQMIGIRKSNQLSTNNLDSLDLNLLQNMCFVCSKVTRFESSLRLVDMNWICPQPKDCGRYFQLNQNFTETKALKMAGDLWMEIFKDKVPRFGHTIEDAPQATLDEFKTEPIAIIGMSCRFPGANNLDEFWNVLKNGVDATCNLPSFRWTQELETLNSTRRAECKRTRGGFLKIPVDEFDTKFFGISPKEVLYMDPQHRLMLEVVWEALEDGAIDPTTLQGTNAGVFASTWSNDYQCILKQAGYDEFYRQYLGNSMASSSARISFVLGTTGPSISTESGCSSAMTSISMACDNLTLQKTNVAVACSANLILKPYSEALMPHVISPEGRCKTFDADANGYARAEAVSALILKRYSDAVKDNDRIWGLIRGIGMSQEGTSASMGTPTVECESLAMQRALNVGGVDPQSVSYVEAHGTGTVVGDPIEMTAISRVYCQNRTNLLRIGSVKTNVGHTESCAAMAGIIKVLLAMKYEMIPPHLNLNLLNPAIDLKKMCADIPAKSVEWKRQLGKMRLAGVNSFGLAGSDTHILLQESPLPETKDRQMERTHHILKLSAKSEPALDILLQKYAQYLKTSAEPLGDICYTANIGRSNFPHKAVIIGKNVNDMLHKIDQAQIMRQDLTEQNIPKQICFLFSGQSGLYPSMARVLFETSLVFQKHFHYCATIVLNNYSIDIIKSMWSLTEYSVPISHQQTAEFCVQYALVKLWESWGITPTHVLGHSLGEYCAAVCAKLLTVEDAIILCAERHPLIEKLPPGKMVVVQANQDVALKHVTEFASDNKKKVLDFASYNTETQTVMAGDAHIVDEFITFCRNKSVMCTPLRTTKAFHCKHMDLVADDYRHIIESIKLQSNQNTCTFISGMTGMAMKPEDVDVNYWVAHGRNPVNFLDASRTAVELGCKIFVEIGTDSILSNFMVANNKSKLLSLPSLKRGSDDWSTILSSLGSLYLHGVYVNWQEFDKFYNRSKVSVPHYPFIGKKYWPEIAVPKLEHPLLGKEIENVTSTKLFQGEVSLLSLSYIRDHGIGHNFIFPGACYIEICAAAAFKSATEHKDFVTVQNLEIESPLILKDNVDYVLQTSVEHLENSMSIKLFHKSDESNTWAFHAAGVCSLTKDLQPFNLPFSIQSTFQSIIETHKSEHLIDNFYKNVASLGMKFGPKFKSLEMAWAVKDGYIFKVKVPEDYQTYFVHPIIIDAMLQALSICTYGASSTKLYLPVTMGNFVVASKLKDDHVYIYSNTDQAILIDKVGHPLVSLSNVKFVDTTAKALDAVLDKQRIPQMWEEVWQKKNSTNDFVLVLQHSSESASNLAWLVFTDGDCKLQSYLLNKLDSFNRKLILAKSSYGQTAIDNEIKTALEFYINRESKADFETMVKTINAKCPTIKIEGVLYMWSLDKSCTSQQQLLQPYLYMIQTLSLLQFKGKPKVVTLTNNTVPLEGHTINYFPSIIWGFTKSLTNENPDGLFRCVDVCNINGVGMTTNEFDIVFQELFNDDKENQVALRQGHRYVPRLQQHKSTLTDLELPFGKDRFHLVLPQSKAIADLRFHPLEHFPLAEYEVEVQVKAYALNFRDVLSVIKPSPKFDTINSVGFDIAGVVTRLGQKVSKWTVGDAIMGINGNSPAFSSHVKFLENDVIRVPNEMTLCEAATLPAVFATAYLSLVEVAQLTNKDTILIHTGSGGVGLCAIQIAKFIGAKIIATAGSNRKRRYLRSLGIEHIYNSRDTKYAKQIMEIAKGQGVTVVLNSLTSEGYKEATLSACAPGARFVEMSKLSVWSHEDVKALRSDVQYSIVDVSTATPQDNQRWMNKLEQWMEQGIIRPLSYIGFDGVNIIDALQHLQKANHIGKVVCRMPEVHSEKQKTFENMMFNDRSTYLVTGGLGGIGLEVGKWMVEKGAKYVVLGGRSNASELVIVTLNQMNFQHGAYLTPVKLDVGDFESCKMLLGALEKMKYPPLRGIMHAAGTLADGLIENHTWSTLSSTLHAKVNGTLNLHRLTEGFNLEHFVMFSSVAALFGSPGQSNHAAGNCFEDHFAHYRHSIGLPATTINWGLWGQVGVGKDLHISGLTQISIKQGLAGLEYVMRSHQVQLSVCNVDSLSTLSKRMPQTSIYVDENLWKGFGKSTDECFDIKPDSFWQKYDLTTEVGERMELVAAKVEQTLRTVLHMTNQEDIQEDSELQELGVDSLMYLEIKNSLQTSFGQRVSISTTMVRDSITVGELIKTLVKVIKVQ